MSIEQARIDAERKAEAERQARELKRANDEAKAEFERELARKQEEERAKAEKLQAEHAAKLKAEFVEHWLSVGGANDEATINAAWFIECQNRARDEERTLLEHKRRDYGGLI